MHCGKCEGDGMGMPCKDWGVLTQVGSGGRQWGRWVLCPCTPSEMCPQTNDKIALHL